MTREIDFEPESSILSVLCAPSCVARRWCPAEPGCLVLTAHIDVIVNIVVNALRTEIMDNMEPT